jgi:hypothetical protein
MCEEWRDDFATFLKDLGPRPRGYSLERKNNNLGYEPGNCRWATLSDQTRNRSDNRLLTIEGKTMCLTDWAEYSGIDRRTILTRLRRKWPVKAAVFEPPRARGFGLLHL